MKFLKGLALSLMGFLLFLSLSIFGLVFMLHSTLLNPDFVVREVNKLDVASLARDLVKEQFGAQLPQWMAKPIDDTLANSGPWLKQQVDSAVYTGYDYFLGKSSTLNLSVDLGPLKADLKSRLWDAVSKSPPPELASIPPAMLQQYFNQLFDQYAGQIPTTYRFGLDSLGTDVRAQLEQVKQYIGYVQLSYNALIGLMLLLVLGIVLIHHQVRSASRSLGSVFFSYGVVEYAGVMLGKNLGLPQLAGLVPVQFQTWLTQVLADLVSPLEMFSLGAAIAGLVLLVVSFVYPRREPAS
ncbi:MAG: hypothetical protein Q8O05_01575 [Chloroflexota bacterium]|nr:hypothetical protein [Chloroflexota bacterium]